ncbi:EF-P 5-aminopentanol modification-associated protein YfmF [Actinomycetes bacterium NPDC127524]
MAIASDLIRKIPGCTLHIVPTDKYKTNTIVFKMKAPLEAETVTKRALLPYVLQNSSHKYPTTPSFRSYLDELYGASFYVDTAKKGENHIISFTIEIANEKFLSDSEPLLEKAIALLSEVIFHPKKDGESFASEAFTNEKRSLKQRISSVYDDKMRYAATRLVEEMCKNEPYALDASGKMDDLESMTPESLYTYYVQALKNDQIDIYVIGDIQEERTEQLIKSYIKLEERTPVSSKSVQKHPGEANEVIETQDIKQGKLNVGYRTNVLYGDPEYYALQLFNGIFGGFSHSKLFINVREKASLAYYASSRVESHKGLLIVMSGIENENYDKAMKIIHEQMKEMKEGNFSDDELSQTKAVVKNQLLETIDVARGLVEILYHNVVAGTDISLDEWLEKTEQTTKEEVLSIAKKVELDTVYFLTGKEVEA